MKIVKKILPKFWEKMFAMHILIIKNKHVEILYKLKEEGQMTWFKIGLQR